jgi:cytochrome P450
VVATVIPAAPGRLPLLGHLPFLLRAPLPFMRSLRALGDVVVIYVAGKPMYVVNDSELVHRILVADVSRFDKGVQYDKLKALLGNGLSTATGVAHRDRRRLMQPAFHPKRVARYSTLMGDLASSMVDDWKDGEVIAVDEAMRRLSLMVVVGAMCSAELGADAVAVIQRDLPVVLRGIPWRALSPIESLERLPLPFNRNFAAANARLRRTVEELIERYRADGLDHNDLLSLLMSAHDAHTGAGLDDAAIRDEVVNLLFAGTETTGNALAWVWHALAANPDVEHLLHEEVDAGGSAYTQRVVREALRLYPPPWLITRRSREPVSLGGYDLPAGASVLFSPYATHRDPAVYPDAERFDPDRWSPERAREVPRHAYMTFGGGAHNCIGEGFALLEMATVTATIAARVRLRPVDRTVEKASATLIPSRLRMRVERRE